MKNNFELKEKDVVIRRVTNGWIIHSLTNTDDINTMVYEDALDGLAGEAQSLRNIIYDVFDYCIRSKYNAGLVLDIKHATRFKPVDAKTDSTEGM
jgi:hypothetical protein